MHGTPSLRNISTLRRSSSMAEHEVEPVLPELPHARLLEVAGDLVVAPRAHEQDVPADPVPAQPRLGEVVDPLGPGGEQHDPQVGVEEVEEHLDLLDDGVVAARLEEGVPVAAGCLEVVLATGRVGEHAVDVDDRGAAGLDRLVAPGPVLGDASRPRGQSSSAALRRGSAP